jgi:hypothetical protein
LLQQQQQWKQQQQQQQKCDGLSANFTSKHAVMTHSDYTTA